MNIDYSPVTEVSGDRVSREQLQRMVTRYSFAQHYCAQKDVLEVACGSGQGLGLLEKVANTVVGTDYCWPLLQSAQQYYHNRIPLIRLDAQVLPFKDRIFDVIILFEAIYYLKDPQFFVKECVRILRPGGKLLICTANKDLPDFNPSPYSYRYFSPCDFIDLLSPYGFQIECFGDCPVDYSQFKPKLLSVIKRVIVRFNLMPATMSGKKFVKRLVFGKLVPMPPELTVGNDVCQLPCRIESEKPDNSHKAIFVSAQKSV